MKKDDINYHVYKRVNEWIVRKNCSKRASKKFFNKNHAINYAIKLANKLNSSVVIHFQDLRFEKIIKITRKEIK